MKKNSKLKVSIIMGSQSDYKVMKLAEKTLKKIIGIIFGLTLGINSRGYASDHRGIWVYTYRIMLKYPVSL